MNFNKMKKELKLDTSKDLISLKENLSKVIDRKISQKILEEKLSSLDTLNLGQIKQLFESISVDLYNSKQGKKIIKEYVNTFRGNKSLKASYQLYESLYKFPENVNDTVIISLIENNVKNINSSELNVGVKELSKIIKEGCKLSTLSADEIDNVISKNSSINESFNSLLNNNKKTIVESSQHFNTIISFINENRVNTLDTDKELVDSKNCVDELNSILSEDFKPWEKQVIKDISFNRLSGDCDEILFEEYKNKCVETIDSIIDTDNIEESIQYNTMRKQILEKKYNMDSFNDDMLMLSELCYVLKETKKN